MQVHYFSDSQPLPAFHKAIVTIGTFDGVHLGHRQIIHQILQQAAAVQGQSVLVTFHPHPRRVVGQQQNDLRLLNTLSEKIELLRAEGIDHLVIVPFTESFAAQSAEAYIGDFLVKNFAPHTLIIGYDHRFGNKRSGNFDLLLANRHKYGYQLIEIPKQLLHDVGVSSTKVRQALLNGEVCQAADFLGYPYFLEGVVVTGKKLGRTIGYPTANIQLPDPDKLVPANGVYAVTALLLPGEKAEQTTPMLRGMMNIGVRPTVNGTHRTIEVNLFDFDREIYGQTLRVYLHQRLRGEQKFDGLDALKAQLAADKVESVAVLEGLVKRLTS
jgi:riboflavin kinase/FMN adenylyltransferase